MCCFCLSLSFYWLKIHVTNWMNPKEELMIAFPNLTNCIDNSCVGNKRQLGDRVRAQEQLRLPAKSWFMVLTWLLHSVCCVQTRKALLHECAYNSFIFHTRNVWEESFARRHHLYYTAGEENSILHVAAGVGPIMIKWAHHSMNINNLYMHSWNFG